MSLALAFTLLLFNLPTPHFPNQGEGANRAQTPAAGKFFCELLRLGLCRHSVLGSHSWVDLSLENGLANSGASLVAQTVKNPPAMQETQVQSLGWEDPLEKGMATHPNNFAWRIPWAEEPGRVYSMGSQRVG